MAEWVTCPACGLKHRLRPNTLCPRCGSEVSSTPSQNRMPEPSLSAPTPRVARPAPHRPTSRSFASFPNQGAAPVFRCELCGASAPTRHTELHQNIGLLVMRLRRSVKGHLCRQCIDRNFREFTLITFFAGWWGIISFFITPFILLNNVIQWVSSRSLQPAYGGPTELHGERVDAAPFPSSIADRYTGAHPTSAGPPRQGLAIASLVLGLASLPTFGIVGVGALAGLVTGIIALVKIQRHPTAYGGRAMAIIGVASSLLSIIMLAALLLVGRYLEPGSPRVEKPGETAFREASSTIDVFQQEVAFGNTAEAHDLAERFSQLLSATAAVAFTGGRQEGALSLTQDHFLTYAELRRDTVCFLVHVPQLKNYQGEARETLLKLAWITAKQATSEARQSRDLKIGVGLRGVLLYGGVVIGMGNDQEPTLSEAATDVDRNRLYEFFTGPGWESVASPSR